MRAPAPEGARLEVEAEFLGELQRLLNRFDAELEVVTDELSYQPMVTITIPYHKAGYIDFELPQFMRPM